MRSGRDASLPSSAVDKPILAPVEKAGLFDLLERIRLRPSMYCNLELRPLDDVETLLRGYEQALWDHQVPDHGSSFSEAFRNYLLVRFGWSTCCGWATAIRNHLPRAKDELSRFFELLDEFRTVCVDVNPDLATLARRLEALSHRLDRYRRRRRDWVVAALREAEVTPSRDHPGDATR